MTVLFEQSLANELRKLSDSSIKRMWIASVERIIGSKWLNKNNLSIRLLTDMEETSQLSYNTLETFYKFGSIKSLRGLHAKIYIIDDKVIITSANLTNTAFTKRYEMGVLIDGNEAKDAISQYEYWWDNKSIPIPLEELNNFKSRSSGKTTDSNGNLPNLWNLPPLPNQTNNKNISGKLSGFEYFIACYEDLAKIYSSVQRLAPNMPLYLEIDGLLDYLFHHGNMPS